MAAIQFLQYILDLLDNIVLLDFIFVPLIVMAVFSIVVRIVLHKY